MKVTAKTVFLLIAGLLPSFCPSCRCESGSRPPATAAADTRPNVLLVVFDTVRADHLSSYGYEKQTSPNLDRLAADGITYDACLSSSPWTIPAIGTVLTSVHPHVHRGGERVAGEEWNGKNIRAMGRLRADLPNLAAILQKHGWATHAVVANPQIGDFGLFAVGFDSVDQRRGDDSLINCRRANAITDVTIRFLASRKGEKPLFLLVHYIDPHAPYDPPSAPDDAAVKGYATRKGISEQRGRAILHYDGEIAFMDSQFGRLLDYLKQVGLYSNTIIVALADHGEAFWEHSEVESYRAPTILCSKGHGHTVYQELLHVPLVLKLPDQSSAGRHVRSRVGTIDVMPTLLSLVGIPAPKGIDGVRLPVHDEGSSIALQRSIFSEHLAFADERKSVVRGNLKYIVNTTTGKQEWYELRSDPGERSSHPELSRTEAGESIAQAMQVFVEASARGGQVDAAVSQETMEALKALGYVE